MSLQLTPSFDHVEADLEEWLEDGIAARDAALEARFHAAGVARADEYGTVPAADNGTVLEVLADLGMTVERWDTVVTTADDLIDPDYVLMRADVEYADTDPRALEDPYALPVWETLVLVLVRGSIHPLTLDRVLVYRLETSDRDDIFGYNNGRARCVVCAGAWSIGVAGGTLTDDGGTVVADLADLVSDDRDERRISCPACGSLAVECWLD